MEETANLKVQLFAQTLIDLLSQWGLRVLGALALLIIGRIVARGIQRFIHSSLTRFKVDATLVPFLSSMTYYIILTFVVVAVLSLFGIQTTSIITVLGAVGLAVGLALQGTLSNFASGVMLLLFRPIRSGDFVEISSTSGTVLEIGIFSTSLNTPDNVRIFVPNGSIYGQIIKNYSTNDIRRNDMIIGISYGDNIGTAMNTIRQALAADPRVLPEPAPVVAVLELADSSVNLAIRPWCQAAVYWDLRSHMLQTLKESLEAAGCSIPFPQRDIHLHQIPTPQPARNAAKAAVSVE